MNTQIAVLRKTSGLSQQEVAERIGVSQRTISRWEKDPVSMPLSKAVGLASVFHCDLDALMKTSDSNMQALTEKEQGLLNHFNRLDAEAQDIVMRLVKYLDSAHK